MKKPGTGRIGLACFMAAVVLCTHAGVAAPETIEKPGERLKFALILTRHGVRSPTWTNERLDEYSKDPWPKWEVGPGLLTPRGRILMTQFGVYYRLTFTDRGLFTADGCADSSHVYIDADTDQRTVETGRAIAQGMFPGCNVPVHALSEGVQDPLFHTIGKEGMADTSLAFSAVAGRIGNNPLALLPAYEEQLNQMQQALLACTDSGCIVPGKKKLLTITPSIAAGSGEHLVEMKGPLNTASTFAENFQLEYLDGFPDSQIGWGRVNEADARSLMAIHAAASDILQRTPYVALVQASNLLTHILRTIEQAEEHKEVKDAIGTPADKVAILVGHDTNIANVAALLDTHWLIDGYQRDDAAPGGALVFELWQEPGQEDELRVYYTAQTPAQMRNAMPLSLEKPPAKSVLFLPRCSHAGVDAPCDFTAFDKLIQNIVDDRFVTNTQIDSICR